MPYCYKCKIEISSIPYRCTFCGMIYCSKHRLPENHKCPFDLIQKGKDFESIEKPLYQDALDFIEKDLTVAKVYEYCSIKQMSNKKAAEILTHFVENSEDVDTRRISILAFRELNLKSKNVFNTLESCILLEDNLIVRRTAIKVIQQLFPKKSKSILEWSQRKGNNSNLD